MVGFKTYCTDIQPLHLNEEIQNGGGKNTALALQTKKNNSIYKAALINEHTVSSHSIKLGGGIKPRDKMRKWLFGLIKL